MKTLETLLVSIDDSDPSVGAVDLALRLAKTLAARLTFCSTVDITLVAEECSSPYVVPDIAGIFETLDAECTRVLADAKAKAAAAGIDAKTLALSGRPADAILDTARTDGYDAVVVGTHGRHGLARAFIGSVAEEVIRHSDRPVFVAAPKTPEDFRRIGIAIENSDSCRAAIEFALDVSAAAGATLVLLHVADNRESSHPTMSAAVQSLIHETSETAKARGIAVEAAIRIGEPVQRILEMLRSENIDLLAMGTHGRWGLARTFLGSTAEGVVRDSPVPVVVERGVAAEARQPKLPVLALQQTSP